MYTHNRYIPWYFSQSSTSAHILVCGDVLYACVAEWWSTGWHAVFDSSHMMSDLHQLSVVLLFCVFRIIHVPYHFIFVCFLFNCLGPGNSGKIKRSSIGIHITHCFK